MRYLKIFILLIFLSNTFTSCFSDLNTTPLDPSLSTASNVYTTPESYLEGLAKLYAGFAVSGQQGPAGQSDIQGIDEGFGQYLRGYWYHQELPTDEALIGWNDQTIKDFHDQDWTTSDGFVYAFYSRVFNQVSFANEYLRQTTDERLNERGVDQTTKDKVKTYRAEARFLRALNYWHGLDLFRNVPFGTENDPIGTYVAKQNTAQETFDFIESELLAIEPDLLSPQPGFNDTYGRASKAAAWMLLSKLYLNAEVYIGQKKYDKAQEYAEKVINAGYELEPTYANLFLADNNLSKEIIFPINFDGVHTKTWGGMTFIIRAGIGGSMKGADSGVRDGWGGTRTTKQLVEKFPADLTGILVDFNAGQTSKYPKVYVPGTHQGNDATDKENALSSVLSNKIYEGYKYFPDANTEIQFTQISSNTAPKFGDNGADGTLETNGAAIVVPEAGFYFIKVDLNNKTYIIEKRNVVINGSATGGEDKALTWNADLKKLSYKGEFAEGSFVVKDNSGLILGDNANDGLLTTNGLPIIVKGSGGHEFVLDLSKPDYTYQFKLTSFDRRGMFYTKGQSLEIGDIPTFTEGYAVNKFKNVTSTGQPGSDIDFPDTDFPMFRLADAYLIAAEAILRNGGSKDQAATYVNKVRERAYSGSVGNVTGANLDLNFILDERAREFYWECQRRTDLVRFGQFTDGTYTWAWKGGVQEGKTTSNHRNVFPIPTNDLNANPNLKQNIGY